MLRARLALSVSDAKSAAAVRQRRTTPIMAYVGPNGGGKSMCAVRDSIPALRVQVEMLLLQLLQQDPAVAMDDSLRQARGPGGVEDP